MAKKKTNQEEDKYEVVKRSCARAMNIFFDGRTIEVLEEKTMLDMLATCYQYGYWDALRCAAKDENLYETAVQIVKEEQEEKEKRWKK